MEILERISTDICLITTSRDPRYPAPCEGEETVEELLPPSCRYMLNGLRRGSSVKGSSGSSRSTTSRWLTVRCDEVPRRFRLFVVVHDTIWTKRLPTGGEG